MISFKEDLKIKGTSEVQTSADALATTTILDLSFYEYVFQIKEKKKKPAL